MAELGRIKVKDIPDMFLPMKSEIVRVERFTEKEKLFEITVDPRFLYLSETHKEALAHLIFAVQERKGFAVVTGEVGTGKTTLIQTLLSRLDAKTKTAFLFNPKVENNAEFLYSICEDLEVKGEKGSKGLNLYMRRLKNWRTIMMLI